MDWLTNTFGTGLAQVFGAGAVHLTWSQECSRAVLIFVYGLFMLRLLGRRIFGKWAALDIVVSMIVGSNLSRALTGTAPLAGTLVATTLLIGLHWCLAQMAARSRRLARLLEGAPIHVVRSGVLDDETRKRQSVTMADIHEAVRQKGLSGIEAAKGVILEPSGKLAVLAGGDARQPTIEVMQ